MNCPPVERANSAWYWLESNENSATASGETYTCGPVTPLSLLSTPSSTKLLLRARWPPTEPPVPTPTPPLLVTLGATSARLNTPAPTAVWARSTTWRDSNPFARLVVVVSTSSEPPADTFTVSVTCPTDTTAATSVV